MESEMPTEQIDVWVSTIRELRKEMIPWIQRREVAAWTALVFYFVILWSLCKVLFDRPCIIPSEPWGSWIVVGTSAVLWYVFFRFIHSQYASIHDRGAYTDVLTSLAFDLDAAFLAEKKIDSYQALNEYIVAKTECRKIAKLRRFRSKWRPIWIVVGLWLDLCLWVRSTRKKKPSYLTNPERQEAASYSLLVAPVILSLCLTLKPLLWKLPFKDLLQFSLRLTSGLWLWPLPWPLLWALFKGLFERGC